MSLIVAPDPDWPEIAKQEIIFWRETVSGLLDVHHIGSTAVPGMPAKPIIDLVPVFRDAASQTSARDAVEGMGYEWMGAHGLAGRAYARKTDPISGKRRIQAHCYPQGHADIRRHLAFRDILRGNATLRAAYASVKGACAARHPEGGREYGMCKASWIDKVEARAMERQT